MLMYCLKQFPFYYLWKLFLAVEYDVVQFGFWFNLDFPMFFSMLIYDNEYQTMENPKTKLNYNKYINPRYGPLLNFDRHFGKGFVKLKLQGSTW